MRAGRRGSALALVCLFTFVAGVLATALVQYGRRGARTAGWARDHAVARLLAESAAEELFVALARAAADPAHPSAAALRGAGRRRVASRDCPGIDVPVARAEAAALARRTRVPVAVEASFTLEPGAPLAADRGESRGQLVLVAQVRIDGRPAVVERIERTHAFQAARQELGRGFDAAAVVLVRSTAPGHPAGSLVVAHRDAGSEGTLGEVLFPRAPGPVTHYPDGSRLHRELEGLTPQALARRAHYVTRSAAELTEWLARCRREGRRVDGVVHCADTGTLHLDLADFAGRAVLSTAGSLVIEHATVRDPARDALVLVAGQGMRVDADRVEASLVSAARDVVFTRSTVLTGRLVTASFPRHAGMPWQDLERMRIRAPDPRDGASPYHVVFAPQPSAQRHTREES